MKNHQYKTKIEWTGNTGKGTLNYTSYKRSYELFVEGKSHKIECSSDSAFLGDESKYNPEDLFLSSLSACHMLWYLHLCAINNIVVTDYVDCATGIMEVIEDGSGKFVEVSLNPTVTIENKNFIVQAYELHAEANKKCFIANSCNFEVKHNLLIIVKQ